MEEEKKKTVKKKATSAKKVTKAVEISENIENNTVETKKKNGVVEFFSKNAIIPYTIIGIALFFLAVMLVAQIKTVSNTEQVLKGKREIELSEELIKLKNEYETLKTKYDENEKIVEEYKNNASSNNELISSMKSAIETYSILAGATDVSGEGIIVTLDDGNTISDGSDVLVHDSDILTVVNELKAAGAEAISVNDERIIATTAIRCVGPVIQINYHKVASPFTIKAIGNAQYLESAMTIKNGVVDVLKKYGINIKVERNKALQVLKFNRTINTDEAHLE